MTFGATTLKPELSIELLGALLVGERNIAIAHGAAEAWKRFFAILAGLCGRAVWLKAWLQRLRQDIFPILGGIEPQGEDRFCVLPKERACHDSPKNADGRESGVAGLPKVQTWRETLGASVGRHLEVGQEPWVTLRGSKRGRCSYTLCPPGMSLPCGRGAGNRCPPRRL